MPKSEIILDDGGLFERFDAYPQQYNAAMQLFGEGAVTILHENVPEYAPERENQQYERTGLLGRSFGSGMGGGAVGQADINTVVVRGGFMEASFGSRLGYAQDVVGFRQQAPIFADRWWTEITILDRSVLKILQLMDTVIEKLSGFLEGKGKVA